VLNVAEHRMLTSQFQQQLERELRNQLELAFGKLAQVEVVRGHPLLNDIRTRGLQQVLDNWDELSDVKTHFVLVDYAAGQYQIQTGHHDGSTGLSSQVVRQEALGDRQRVGDTAAQMIQKDFGVVGTFQKLDGSEVKLAIRGGGLVDSLGPWVQPGDAFAVVRLTQQSGKLRASPLEWAILQVIEAPQGGLVRCRYFCRYEEDRVLTDAPPVAGYRCLKLNTIRGPLRLRLVDEKTQAFLSGLRVMVCPNDEFKTDLTQGTTIKGLFEAEGPFSNVAYVRVLSGASVLVEFPVPLVDDRTVVCRMSENAAALKQGEIELRKERWVRWHQEALSLAEQRLAEFNAALSPKTLEAALKLGRQHQQAMAAEMERLKAERAHLEQLAVKNKMPLDLSSGLVLAGALGKRQVQLEKYLTDLDKLIKEANSDQTRELIALLKRAELLEKQADFDKAIDLYESVMKVRDSAEVKMHLEQLKAAWAIKGKDHAEARQFIYTTLPALDLPELKIKLATAKEMFKRCQAAQDRKTPLKLLLVNVNHATALAKELEVLRRAPDSEDNRASIKAMVKLAKDLGELQHEVATWLGFVQKAPK
jgi:tetratricopeptide (TPR) repeat protein